MLPCRLVLIAATIGCVCDLPADEIRVDSPDAFRAAAQRLQPGDELVLASGEWRDADLVVSAAGTEDRPIIVRAEEPGRAVFTGKSCVRIGGEHIVVSGLLFRGAFHPDALLEFRVDSKRLARNCRVTNCAFIDCNPPEGSREDAKYLSLYGRDNRVDRCAFSGKRSVGTTLVVWLTGEEPGGHRIDSNWFGPRPELGRNGGETIRIGDSRTSLQNARCVVEGNLFEECNGEAEIISNKSCENVYSRNAFLRCSGALTLRHGHRCVVEANVFLGEEARGTGGVRIIGEDHRVVNNYMEKLAGKDARAAISLISGIADGPLEGYSPVVRATVAHNTLIDCRESLLIGFGDEDVDATVPPRESLIAGNLLVSRRGPLIRALTPVDSFTWRTNLASGADAGVQSPGITAIGDPRLERGAGGLLRPGSGSPALDAADPAVGGVKLDLDGQPRGERPDIGCDEATSTEPFWRVITRRDVGPGWLEPERETEADASDPDA